MDDLGRRFPVTAFVVRFGCGFAFGVLLALLLMVPRVGHYGFGNGDPVVILFISGTAFGLGSWLGGNRFWEWLGDLARGRWWW